MTTKMTALEKERVAVARDALKNLVPRHVKSGFSYIAYRGARVPAIDGGESCAIARTLQKKCDVCLKGALLLAAVARKNDFNFETASVRNSTSLWVLHSGILDRLAGLWSRQELDEMECAFECYPGYRGDDKANTFGTQFKKDSDRMVAILKNVIKNRGVFKP